MLFQFPLKMLHLCIHDSWRTDSGNLESNYHSSERKMLPKALYEKMLGNQKPTANEPNATKITILRCVQGEIEYFICITPATHLSTYFKNKCWYDVNKRIRIPLTGFQHRSFHFRWELKQPNWVLPASCFPAAVKLWSSIKYSRQLTVLSHSSRAACHLGIANLDRSLKTDEISKLYFVFQDSLSPNGKVPVRNVTTKLAFFLRRLTTVSKFSNSLHSWRIQKPKHCYMFLVAAHTLIISESKHNLMTSSAVTIATVHGRKQEPSWSF